MGVAGRHEEGCVDFEAPRAALDGSVRWEAGEVSVGIFNAFSKAIGLQKARNGEGIPIH